MAEARRIQEVEAPRAVGLPIEAGIALAVAALQCWLIFSHSPWRDEEQALLIAGQPLGALFGSLHYEGHPALYYLVLKAATLAAPGASALKLTAAACSLGTLALIWTRAPFGTAVKAALSLNYLILFEYGVIARSYGLGALIFFAFVAERRSRGVAPWVLLALLANVSIHTAMLAGVCALWQLKEGRWSWKGAAILGLSGVIALLTLWPAHDVLSSMAKAQTPVVRAVTTLAHASRLLLWSEGPGGAAVWGTLALGPVVFLAGALFPLVSLVALGRRQDHRALFALCFLGLFAFGTFVYVGWLRHLGFAALLMIGLLWAQAEEGERLNLAARAWLALAALGGVWFAATALVVPFSGASALAAWAERTGAADKPWAAAWGPTGLDFSGVTGRPTFNLQKGCWNTFQRWNYDTSKVVTDGDVEAFAEATGGGYVLGPKPLTARPGRRLERAFQGPMLPETIYVYRVWPTGPASPRTLPDCG